MKLLYHRGKNFGDAINPLMFESLLPNFFNEEKEYSFLGIGSVLGLQKPDADVKKMIVFSSGIGGGDEKTYGGKPTSSQLSKYDFRCVRGPLTAKYFNLPDNKAVCDGAILLPNVIAPPSLIVKKYKFSYMPHVGTFTYFSYWKELLASIDINLIDPRDEVNHVIEELNKTEILFTEAMHGAIIADAYRIPWIPIRSKKTVNSFKWKDFCLSLDLKYQPNDIKTLYDFDFLKEIIDSKLKFNLANNLMGKGYMLYQKVLVEKTVLSQFNKLKNQSPILSKTNLLNLKKEELLDLLYQTSKDYS
jgi:succinoglycan biosynthesis protein ExoV